MLPKNPNQMELVQQTTLELQQLNHDVAEHCRRIRKVQNLFSEDIVILSGGIIPAHKLERIEMEQIERIPIETLVSLGLVLKHRVKIAFEPIAQPEQNAD